MKETIKKVFISAILPAIIIYLLPMLYGIYLERSEIRYYDTRQLNWFLVLLTCLLIISVLFLHIKSKTNIPYFVIGMGIAIISIPLNHVENYLFYQRSFQIFALIAGYAAISLFLYFDAKYEIRKRKNRIS